MKPPKSWIEYPTRILRYSLCIACNKWHHGNNIFYHEGTHWVLCRVDFADYWENTDVLQSDYRGY